MDNGSNRVNHTDETFTSSRTRRSTRDRATKVLVLVLWNTLASTTLCCARPQHVYIRLFVLGHESILDFTSHLPCSFHAARSFHDSALLNR